MRRYWKQAVVIIFMVVAIITPTMDNFINNLEKEIEKKLKTIESADLNIMKKSLETSQILVNAFQKVLDNLEKMTAVRNPQKTFIGVGYVLTTRNQSNLGGLLERLDEMGIDYLYIRPVEEAPDITPTIEEMLDLRKQLVELTKDKRIKYMLTIADRVVDKNNNLPCIAHSLTSIIHANGDVSLCEKRRNESIVFGNINETCFKQIWESPYREQVTQRLLNAECQQGCSACRITGFNMLFDSLSKLNTKHFI